MTFAPIPVRTISTSAPYSYRQGMTFLERLEELQTLVNLVADQLNDNTDAYSGLINDANASIQTALDSINGLSGEYDAQLSTMRDEFTEHTNAVAASLAELSAAVTAANAANDTATGLVADFNTQVAAFQADVDSLSGTVDELNASAVRKNDLIVNVKDFGAVGDGVHDDTQNIRDAYTFAGVGGRVFFPKGDYKVTSTINTPNDCRTIGHCGLAELAPATRIVSTVTNGPAFYAVQGEFEGIRFDGPDSVPGSVGLSIASTALLRDVVIYGFDRGIYMTDTWYSHIENVFIRFCKTAMAIDHCYNVNIYNIRIAGKQKDGVNYGQGIELTNQSMVTLHGGSIEHYTIGIAVNDQCGVTCFGVYFESYYPLAKGVSLQGTDCIVSVYACQVYLDNHRGWIDAASQNAGNVVNGIGNFFKSSANSASTAYAYYWGSGNLERLTTNLIGDNWGRVTHTGFDYTNSDVISQSASIVQYPTGTAKGPLNNGGHIVVGGSFEIGVNRQLILGHTGLPGAPLPVKGAMIYDPQTSKPVFGDGAVWRDAMGNAI